jgi:hypothetical protein
MLKLYILSTFVISPYTTPYPSAMGRGVWLCTTISRTSHDQMSAPLAIPAGTNWKYAYDEVDILPPKHQSTLQSVDSHLFTCRAENAVENLIIDLADSPIIESICVYLRSGEWRAVFRRNWRCCLAFPADLSERKMDPTTHSKGHKRIPTNTVPWTSDLPAWRRWVASLFTRFDAPRLLSLGIFEGPHLCKSQAKRPWTKNIPRETFPWNVMNNVALS